MSDQAIMAKRNNQAINVIEDYIQRKKGLTTMEDIHRRVFDKKPDFSTWGSVTEQYEEIEWDEDTFEDFLLTSKQLVEGGLDRISEAYFELKKPKDLTVDRVQAEFDQHPYDEDGTRDEEHDGFRYNVRDDGVVQATYVYTDVKTNVTTAAEVEKLVSENSIHFRIDVDNRLAIVESTYPPHVQKMKGVFRRKTDFAAIVCGSLTSNYSEANERVEAFRDSFEEIEPGEIEYDEEESEPKLIDVKSVKLHNPEHSEDERIDKIDVEGDDLADHPLIDQRLDEGYIMRGLVARMKFENELFDIAFSGSDMMGYAKVEDIGDYAKGQRLMEDIRGRYMEHFRGV